MTEGEATEIKAPDGTFQSLAEIQEKKYHRLGNAYTKRVVKVSQAEGDSTNLNVALWVWERMGGEAFLKTTFKISPQEAVTNLQATREIGYPQSTEPLEPPSFAAVLREIRVAQHIQPKLKR